jgi:hypothetical protein
MTGIIIYERGLSLTRHVPVPPFVGVLTAVRGAFLQINGDALADAAHQGPLTLQLIPSTQVLDSILPTPPSGAQALLIMLMWCAVALGLSYLLVRTRDVTD